MLLNSAKSSNQVEGIQRELNFFFMLCQTQYSLIFQLEEFNQAPCSVLSVGNKINSNRYLPELQSQCSGHSLSLSLECSVISSESGEGTCDVQIHWRKFGANVGQEISVGFLEEAAL